MDIWAAAFRRRECAVPQRSVKANLATNFDNRSVSVTLAGPAASNYQDLWWAAPAISESGWGINLNHEGDTIFATWFTYDLDGTPMWLVVTAPKTGPAVYTGDLLRTAGARFDAFDATKVVPTKVGTATFTFADGNTATFAYTIAGVGPSVVTQTRTITREIFAAPGTACQ